MGWIAVKIDLINFLNMKRLAFEAKHWRAVLKLYHSGQQDFQ
jgi:hypothetical protein